MKLDRLASFVFLHVAVRKLAYGRKLRGILKA